MNQKSNNMACDQYNMLPIYQSNSAVQTEHCKVSEERTTILQYILVRLFMQKSLTRFMILE